MVSAKQGVFAVLILYFAYWYISSPTFHPDLVKNKVVVICGASQGIGEQLAYKYASYGCRLILASRQLGKLEKVKKRCLELGSPETHVIVSDFSRYEDSFNLHKETVHIFGKVDVLILNHAIIMGKYWNREMLSEEILRRHIDTNYISFVALATLFTPQLTESGGSIGVISSTLGLISMPNETLYSASKHAVHGFFNSYRWDLMAQNVRNLSITICVLGPIATQRLLDKLPPNTTHIKGIPLTSPADTAEAIMHNVALRYRQVYIPNFMKIAHYVSFFTGDAHWVYLLKDVDSASVYVR